jgi:hypothetical protein
MHVGTPSVYKYKMGPNAGIITSIMQSISAKTVTWRTIKEERERYVVSYLLRFRAVPLILIFLLLPSLFSPIPLPYSCSRLAASVSCSGHVASVSQHCSPSPCLGLRRPAAARCLPSRGKIWWPDLVPIHLHQRTISPVPRWLLSQNQYSSSIFGQVLAQSKIL